MSDHGDRSATAVLPAGAQRLLDALPDPALVIDSAVVVVAVNRAWRDLARGVPEGRNGCLGCDYEAASQSVLGRLGDASKRCCEGLRAVLWGEVPSFRFEDGDDPGRGGRWTMTTATPFELQGEQGALVIHSDISTARSAEARFTRLLESPLDALLVVDERGTIHRVNAQMEVLFGYRREELLGMNMELLLPERFRQRHRHHHQAYFRDPRSRSMGIGLELFARHKDGGEFPVEIALTPLETGETLLISAAVRDMSRLQEAEIALRESRRRMALHVHNTPLAVIEWEASDHTITAWNLAAERLFGYRADEVIGRLRADIVVPPEEWERSALPLDPRARPERARTTRRNVTRDGRELVCEWYYTPLVDERGEVVGVAALALDITTRQRALERLLNAQEEERGRISRDLHDQVGQALTGLMLGLTRANNDPALEHLGELRDMASQTLEEVRRISRDLRPAILDELGLEAAIRRFSRELEQGHALDIDLLVRPPQVMARNEQIVVYRVVQEALTNVARHADAGHASVVITHGAGEVQLVIEDDGRGFDPNGLQAGKTIGLAGMRERLELLGGSLDIDSTEGRGTIVTGRFPTREAVVG